MNASNIHPSRMKGTMVFLILIFIFFTQSTRGQNAPISTIGTVVTTGLVATVPITATGFTNIGSCNMQLHYDAAFVTCTGLTAGPEIPDNITPNINNPGVVTWGWYTWPGVTLQDNSVIFTLTFTKKVAGTSGITWDGNYGDRQWGDGSSARLNDKPLGSYYFPGSITFQEDAPKIIAPEIIACPNETIDIPITVKSFNTIGALSLTLLFDAAVLQYQSFTNNSGFPGLGVDNPSTGNMTMAGFNPVAGTTLPDDAIIFTLHFNYLGGTTNLAWYEDEDDASKCETTGPYPDYNVLNDVPQSTYYIDGKVSPCAQMELKVFLQGLFNTDKMNKAQDYVGSNFQDKFTGTVADLITVELHDANTYANIIRTFSDVKLDQDGKAFVGPIDGLTGTYFITVKNRNHLETVSALPIDFSSGNVEYDFTTAANKAFGNNMKELATGVWGIYAGDVVDRDEGVINTADREPINDDYLITKRGYFPNDINGDGTINTTDREIVNDNYLLTITKKIPQ